MARVSMANQGLSGGPSVLLPVVSPLAQAILEREQRIAKMRTGKFYRYKFDSLADQADYLESLSPEGQADYLFGNDPVRKADYLAKLKNKPASSPTPGSPTPGSPTPGSPTPNPTTPNPGGPGEGNSELQYLYADLAKAYGMDASTAYQEALSNTSYQRAVKDLQAAGLNPVLAATSLNGAGGVYGASALTQISPGIVSSGRTSAHANYNALSNLGQVALGLGTLLLTRNPYKAWTAASAGKMIFGSLGNMLDQA